MTYQAEILCDSIDCPRRGHGSSHAGQLVLGEVGDGALGVRSDDGHRVRGSHEETTTEDLQ